MKVTRSLFLASAILIVPVTRGEFKVLAQPTRDTILAQTAPANEHEQGEHDGNKQKKTPKSEVKSAPGAEKPRGNQAPTVQRQSKEHKPVAQKLKSAPTPTVQKKSRVEIQQQQHAAKSRNQKPLEHEARPSNPNTAPKPAEQSKNPGHPGQHGRTVETTRPGQAQIGRPTQRASVPSSNTTAVPPPTQTISKQQFIAPKGQAPTANISQIKQERHEIREGNRLIIREPDRTIVAEGGRTFVRHNEVDRFAVDARGIHVEKRGGDTVTTVERPDGVRIINISDDQGHLIRRLRRDPDGREIIIIDNSFAGPRLDEIFVNLAPPVIRIPRDRYIVDADRANEADIYDVFIAPPVERIDHRYTLEEVRYNEPLRARMPRVDLDINFDTGSWQLTPDQVDRLAIIAEALNRAIAHNPREVFLIEGHTDAVGSDIDNLSLSDRRAESVAVALTEEFHVPAENLVTQGYGKQDLKIPTNGPERANRRVAIRRITPLIDRVARN